MNESAIYGLLGILVFIVVVIVILNGMSARKEKREREQTVARAAAFAAKEQARATVEAARAKEEARQAGKVKLGALGVLVVVGFLVWGGITINAAFDEWGTTRRYKARQATYVELDMGKTIRHSQLMEMMTDRAWAEAYAKAGGPNGGGPSGFLWLVIIGLGLGLAYVTWVNYQKTGTIFFLEPFRQRGPPLQ